MKFIEFLTGVRGFHCYKKYWQPAENEFLDCGREAENPYNYFAIKIYQKADEKIIGYLLMEIFWPTKYLLDRGKQITATLKRTSYYTFRLVQEA